MRRSIRHAVSLSSLVVCAHATAAEPDSSGELEGIWAGTCSDDGKVSDVRGEICVRGSGEARDEKTRTFSFDRNRVTWDPRSNERSTVVHRVQWLRLVAADRMEEEARELTVQGDQRKETSFACRLTRVRRVVKRSGPNACPP
jgi:hypothetical protein